MIEYIKLVNTGTTYTLNYVGDKGEKLIPEVPISVFANIQALVAYVEQAKTLEEEQIENLQNELESKELLTEKLKSYLLETELDDEAMLDLIEIYPVWSGEGVSYEVGAVVRYEGRLFKVIQAHVSQADWFPSTATASLFREILPAGVIPEWVQPTGAHDAYNIGDRVVFNGAVYESLIDGNVWSPEIRPEDWKLI